MKKFAVTLLSLAVAMAAMGKEFPDGPSPSQEVLNAKLGPPTYTLDVKWVRIDSPVSEFRDGTCYIYLRETFTVEKIVDGKTVQKTVGMEKALHRMGDLLQQCVDKGAHVVNEKPIDGARRINFWVISENNSPLTITKLTEKLYGPNGGIYITSRGSAVLYAGKLHAVGGFYADPDPEHGGSCNVVGFPIDLGHEVEHCEKGEFHDDHWHWLEK
jgi:hypothetical protein